MDSRCGRLLDRILKNFKLDKYFITAGKSILYLVNLQNLVAKYCTIRKIWSCEVGEFCILLYYAWKTNTPGYYFAACSIKVYKIYQFRKTIFSLFHDILQPDFANLLNKGCSFKL